MKYKDIIENIGQPILVKNHDVIISRVFQDIEFIKKNAQISIHWSVGFLVELNDNFVKFSSEYNSGLWDHPVVWARKHVEKIYELSPTNHVKKPINADEKLPQIVYIEWEDSQTASAEIATEKVLSRNKLKTLHTVGFLIDKNAERIVLAEELNLETNKARTSQTIYPEFANGMLYLSPSKEITAVQEPKESET